MSWEIDFFGRIRRATEAQKALFLGTQEARRGAVLTLVADVARVYLELRDFDRRLAIARRTIQTRRENVQSPRTASRAASPPSWTCARPMPSSTVCSSWSSTSSA